MRQMLLFATLVITFSLSFSPVALLAGDQPQWGERFSRNMVSTEVGLPANFEPGTRNPQTGGINLPVQSGVKWVATLGNVTYGTPVVAGGRVFIGTNNGNPRDPRFQDDRGVLMCFDEKTGAFQWQLNVPKFNEVKWSDWQYCGIPAAPVVEGDKLYLVSNRCEVVCLDAAGMANGNQGPYTDEGRHMVAAGQPPVEPGPQDADILWIYDMSGQLQVEPHNASNCSILLLGDLLYVCTSNGVEWTHSRVIHPEAPSVVALDKNTGMLLARDEFGIGPDIIHGQWSSPALGQVGDKQLLFWGAGNGFLYAFEPIGPRPAGELALLKNVWRINGHPLAQTQDNVPLEHCHDTHSYEVTAMPVFYKERVYVTFTQEPFHNMKLGWLTCLDATKTGDITRSGIRWSYDKINASVSTVSIADGLIYAAGFDGNVHCLDAETGQVYWVHDAKGPIWGSTLVADGKLYVGTVENTLWILAAGKELKVLTRIRLRDPLHATPVAANGVLYVATDKHLYAVGPTASTQ